MADEPLENVEDSEVDPGVAADADRQALIDRTQARLDEVTGIESVDEDEKPVVDEKPKDDLTPTDGNERPKDEDEKPKDDAKDEESEDDKDTEAENTDEEESVEPTLPESYRRSLVAYGNWTDKEIDAHFKANPEMFLEMAGKIHQNRNAETAGYAQAGRQARAAVVQPNAGGVVPDKKLPGQMEPVDVTAVAEKFGNEELVNAIVSPVNAVIKQVNAILPQLEESRVRAEQSRIEVLNQQVETFFTAKEMKPYSRVYGNATKSPVTADQQKNREKVLIEADAVISGAALQGRPITVEEGLLRAHDFVAGDFKEQVIRDSLRKKTKKRAKGITAKPSHRGKPPGDGKPTTRKQLEAKAKVGLDSIFSS